MNFRFLISLTMFIAVFCIILNFHLYERKNFQEMFGYKAAILVYGKCDKEIKEILSRDIGGTIYRKSEIFVDGPSSDVIYPVSIKEEKYLLALIRNKFGWHQDARYILSRNGDGIHIQPLSAENTMIIDGVQFDECGNLVGDNYPTRLLHEKLNREKFQSER